MEITVITSSIMWPIMLLLWIGFYINTKYYKDLSVGFEKNKGLIIISSILWMILWSLLVANHNITESLANVIISLVWWIILLKSSIVLALPSTFTKAASKLRYSINFIKSFWIICIIIGLYLINYAYYWVSL